MSPPPTSPPFEPKPANCKVSEHSEKGTAEYKIWFIKIGENSGLVKTLYSDGTVTYTVTDGVEVGGTVGASGAKINIGKLERGEKVDFGAGVKFDYGSTWTFKDQVEADAMQGQLEDYLQQEKQLAKGNPGMALWYMIKGYTDPPKPPNQTVGTIEVKVDANAKVGLSLPWDTDPKAESGIPNVELADFGAKFGLSGKWTTINDSLAGTTTYTTAGEVSGQYTGTLGPLASELKGVLGTSMAITRDKDNNITKVALVSTTEGKGTLTAGAGQTKLGGKATDADAESRVAVTTTSLDVSTPQQRALVDGWLQSLHDNPLNYVSPTTLYPDTLTPGNEFQNLMYTNATVSNVVYDKVTDKVGFAAEVKAGVALGIDFSLETSDSRAAAASYLNAPSGNQTRTPVDFPECIAR